MDPPKERDPVTSLHNAWYRQTFGPKGLFVLALCFFLTWLAISQLTPGTWLQSLLWGTAAVAVLLLMARYIVYSYHREKSKQQDAHHNDHIIQVGCSKSSTAPAKSS